MKLFLDANVLIDFMSERLPHYLEAATIFTLAVEHKCTIAVSKKNKYRISPLIKSMETGFQVSEDISDDYKKEIGEIRTKRSL